MKNKHTKPAAELKAQATDWAKLDAMSDAEIDYSDIPKLGDDFFKQAARNPFYRPVKAATTVRLDTDILAWLRSQGKGYQTRINQILRDAMLKDIEHH
jgi:uncharacterized protein (DUF4415 family)